MVDKVSLANLKKFDSESGRRAQQKGQETRMLNKQIQDQFKRNAKAFSKVLKDIPELSSLDVIRMCIHLALQENNYEDAARWAKELAEYEKPKLQRIEQTNINKTADFTDEELAAILKQEGIDLSSISLQ
jgi:hypothetical protein